MSDEVMSAGTEAIGAEVSPAPEPVVEPIVEEPIAVPTNKLVKTEVVSVEGEECVKVTVGETVIFIRL